MRGKSGADREISVNTYTGGFTTMLNHHLRNRNLSLKAVGLLSKMLSLPPDWDYSIRGLAMLNTDGIDGIRTAMKELEDEGYVVRVQSRDERGRMSRNKYTVYALPQKEKPSPDLPSSENPTTVKPPPDEPMTEKPTQINTNQVIPKKRNDSLSKYQSINPDRMDAMDERERYEEIIRENLEVDILSQDSRYDIDRVNEIIEVMLDAICSTSPTLRVNNADMPKEVVKSRLLKLNSSHIDYVFDAMRKSPSDIRNIRAYMLTALYDKATNKQFITVQTKNGNTFYIVIDYDAPINEEEEQYKTYFLNVVDDRDLFALLDDEDANELKTCICDDKCVVGDVNTDCPVCKTNMSECTGTEPVPETPTEDEPPVTEEPKQSSNMGMIIAIVAIAGIGGAAYYYFKFIKGKKQKDDDMDFFDDEGYEEEPYINEDREPEIADDEETEEDD